MKTQGNRTQIRLQFRNQTPDHLCRGFSFFFLHRFTSRHSPNSLLYERTGFLALPYQNWHLTWPQTKDCDALTPLLFPKRSSYYSLGIISLGLPHTHLMAEALSLNPLPPLRQSSDPFNYNQCFFFFFSPPHLQASGITQLLNSCLKLTFWLSTDIEPSGKNVRRLGNEQKGFMNVFSIKH